ncbi:MULTISPECIES: tripartite tricarboxylate transporter permease [Bosea]|uniref:tripartite tricarboxylate transporter permease n=1 Tax=Bosea TaxID=85413 RepID=UPI002150429D|nr:MULTISPECIES: tripartite tricarboxylate transporter permease [Bosea]MCR4524577.1 tripartite tricarboxylate transporter permease [Bosea sp. 47.2.35]MDR6829974.1 putative tricarboxylic transport membrane protein [Bosea robiniae]MDR6896856.1 putative tricarboxylic transport membrane protein [Bosea sp. BE109]MDR7140122.1 putative tricarboxylic transport membrane protein [Bosea sp. BE168]MDR7176819.1 putative tricarboxylic transport membrane protein [Bosea sp. BE271]
MDAFAALLTGFQVALTPLNLAVAFAGVALGTAIGALPGVGPINAVALLLPLCFALKLPPETALILLAGLYYGSGYGGRISSILLNIPGDPGLVMTTLDGYPLAKSGRGAAALAISGIGSFVGGTSAVILMTFLAVPLTRLALSFGPADYVALMVLSFALLGTMSEGKAVKTWIAVALGLLFAMVGVDGGTGVERFTFGSLELLGGIDFTSLTIGLFAVAEILFLAEGMISGVVSRTGNGARLTFREIVYCIPAMLRATGLGFFLGVLPGTGASVASAMAYTAEKRISDKGTFGKGDMRGLAAPETADNAAQTGSMVPMLALGIPGSGTTAVMLGAFMMYSITPGPLLFTQRPEVAWGLIASMYIGNLMLLVLNLPLVGLFARLLLVPAWILYPGILALSYAGVYAVSNSAFELIITTGIGVLAYILRKGGIPLIPLMLAFVLARLLEDNFRRALSLSDGGYEILFSTPTSIVLWLLAVVAIGLPLIRKPKLHPAVPVAETGKPGA